MNEYPVPPVPLLACRAPCACQGLPVFAPPAVFLFPYCPVIFLFPSAASAAKRPLLYLRRELRAGRQTATAFIPVFDVPSFLYFSFHVPCPSHQSHLLSATPLLIQIRWLVPLRSPVIPLCVCGLLAAGATVHFMCDHTTLSCPSRKKERNECNASTTGRAV